MNPDRMGESLELFNVLKKHIKQSHVNIKTERKDPVSEKVHKMKYFFSVVLFIFR